MGLGVCTCICKSRCLFVTMHVLVCVYGYACICSSVMCKCDVDARVVGGVVGVVDFSFPDITTECTQLDSSSEAFTSTWSSTFACVYLNTATFGRFSCSLFPSDTWTVLSTETVLLFNFRTHSEGFG